ncbi:uncharacterized protein [Montipora capricornis]|uniref:uncharacterized protein n=1 Tax=Montipora capricornis TaxID=246305 RepID=UPI0035F1956F
MNQQHAGNDRLGFVCEEDFIDKKKPVQWEEAITKLRGEFATNMVIQAFSDVMHQEIVVLTVHGEEEDCMRTVRPSSGICFGTIFLGHTGNHYVAIVPTNTGTGSYADATKLPASTSDDNVVVVERKTAVLKKERLPPKKSQENVFNQRSWKTTQRKRRRQIPEMECWGEEEFNPGVPVWRGERQFHLFRKDDREEIITISEESADEDSTPKESNDLNAAKRIKRRRNSSREDKEKDVDVIDLTMSFEELSSAENTPTKTGQNRRPSNAKAKDLFNDKSSTTVCPDVPVIKEPGSDSDEELLRPAFSASAVSDDDRKDESSLQALIKSRYKNINLLYVGIG